MKLSIYKAGITFFQIVFFLILLASYSSVHAQGGQCGSQQDRRYIAVFFQDEHGAYWGNSTNCFDSAHRGIVVTRPGDIPNSVDTHQDWLQERCPGQNPDDAFPNGGFSVRTFRCNTIYDPMVIDVHIPAPFTCLGSSWRYIDRNGNLKAEGAPQESGRSCRISITAPVQGASDYDDKIFFTMDSIETPVPNAPVCGPTSGTVTLSWSGVPGNILGYGWRLNRTPYTDWYNPALDSAGNTVTATSVNVPITSNTDYQWAVTATNRAGRYGTVNWSSTFSCLSNHTLTRNVIPAAGGTIQCSITAPDSGYGACSTTYAHNTIVYVRANASSTYTFTGFASGHGCSSISNNVCTLRMDQNRSITANFLAPTPFVQIRTRNPQGTPVPVRGMTFTYSCFWPICFNTTNSNIPQDVSSVNSPAIGGNQGGAGIVLYPNQTLLGITPAPAGGTDNTRNNGSGSPLAYDTTWNNYWWSNYPSTGSRTVNFVVETRFSLTTSPNPPGSGSFRCRTTPSGPFSDCATTYAHNTIVYVQANASSNYTFTGFASGHGCSSISNNVCTLNMTTNRSITANFALMPDLAFPPVTTPAVTRANPASCSSNPSYTIRYCNNGPGNHGGTFTMRVINSEINREVLISSRIVPSVPPVPPAGGCTTYNIFCSSLGDSFGDDCCNTDTTIRVELDTTNTIPETNEMNNTTPEIDFSAVAGEPFYKLKDASVHRLRSIDVAMPVGIQQYDTIDDVPPPLDRFVMGATGSNNSAGIVSSESEIRILGGDISTTNSQRTNYTDNNTYLGTAGLTKFLDYAKAQKPVRTITDYNQIGSTAVNVYTGSLTISALPTSGATDYVLLVNGDVTINQNFIPATDNSVAIIATGTITIASPVNEINAILIANTVNLTNPANSISTTSLKIKGNLISSTPVTITRNRATNPDLQPNLFVVFNPQTYMELLPHLSDITVEGRQVQ